MLALLCAWMMSLLMVKPVAAQGDIADSTPCFSSSNLTNISSGGVKGITNQPVISGNGNRVAFWSVNNLGGGNVDGNIEIFVRETNSNSLTQLTNSVGSILGGFNLEPSINAAGTHIAFYSDRDLVEGQNADGNFEIFLARRATNGSWSITQVTNTKGSANLFPSINAAGNRIAFVSDDSELHNIDQSRVNSDRNFEIFLVTIPNSGALQFRQITNTGAGVTNDQPVINAAGNRIAYTAATGQTAQIFVWDEGRANPAQLTQTDINDQPSISADGTNIVYIATASDDRSRVVLHTLSADGSESRAQVIVPAASNTKYRSPSISGNGKRVVYVAEQGSGSAIQINVLLYDVKTGLGVPISEVGGGTGEQPAISSDGTRVTFVGVQAVGGSTENIGSDIWVNECPQADLKLEFVTQPPTIVLAGNDIEYQFRITNAGPSVATDAFYRSDLGALPGLPSKVTRLLPAGCTIDANDILVCDLGDIGVNATRTFTMGFDIPPDAGLADIVSDIEVGANVVDSNPSDNRTGQFKTRVFEEAALSLSVTTDRSSLVAGSLDVLTYELNVTNAGPSQARSARITDTLPIGAVHVSTALTGGGGGASCAAPVGRVISCALGNLTAGATAKVTIRVRAAASSPASWTNVATVRSLTAETNLANNTVSTPTTVIQSSDMAITKVVTPTATVVAGREVTFTLTYTNLGFSDTDAVRVIDTLPANVSYVRSILPANSSCVGQIAGVTCNFAGTLSAGQSRSFSIVALVSSVVPAGPITNTARVFSGRVDPNPANDITPPVQVNVTLLADLGIEKTVNKNTPDILEPITYTVKVRNNGPSQAYNVVVTDLLPSEMTFISANTTVGSYDDGSGFWTIGTLPVKPVGQEDVLTIRAFVQADGGGDVKTNTAEIGSTVPEPPLGLGNTSSVVITAQLADIQVGVVSVPAPATPVIAGKRLTYTVTITNAGPTMARSVVLTDVLPTDVFLVSTTPHAGRPACNNGSTVVCNVGNVNSGTVLKYTVVITREDKGFITNTVTVHSPTPDLSPGNNSAQITNKVDPDLPHHLVYTIQPPTVVVAGEPFIPVPVVEIRDQFDNLIVDTPGHNDQIALVVRDGTVPVGTLCGGLHTDQSGLQNGSVAAVGGVATFTGINYTTAEVIRLRARDASPGRDAVVNACSNPIGINPGAVKQLTYKTAPQQIVAGDISGPITVQRRDEHGNLNFEGPFTVNLFESSPGTGTFLDSNDVDEANVIASITIVSGTAESTYYYTDTVAGTYQITASATVGVAPAVQAITVTAAPAQELLVVIAAPLTSTAGVSSDLFTVQRTDRFNNPNSTDPTVTVNLTTDSTTGQGVFRNIANSQTITRVQIPIGSSTAQFRYRDTIADTYELNVEDAAPTPPILNGDSVTITVVPSTTYRLVYTSTPKTIVAGAISTDIFVAREDFYGNRNFNDPALTVTPSSSSNSGAALFYPGGSGSAVPSVTIPFGSDFTTFRHSDERAGVWDLTASAAGKISATQKVTITPEIPSKLVVVSTSSVITAGAPAVPITLQRQDIYNNPAPGGPALEIQLSSTSAQGQFVNLPSTVIAQTTIPSGQSDVTVGYRDTLIGTWQLTFDGAGAFDTSQMITVTAGAATKLVFTSKPISTTAGFTSTAFVVQRQDQFNNPNTAATPLTVNLTSSSTGTKRFISGVDNVTTVTSIVIAGGQSSASFLYYDTRAAVHTITADDTGPLTAAITPFTVVGDVANKLVFINNPITATAGLTTTDLLIVQVQDRFSNPVTPTVTSPVQVELASSPPGQPHRFVHPTANTVLSPAILSISNSSTGSFRYYAEKAGPPHPTISAAEVNLLLTGDSETVTILPAAVHHLVFTTTPITLTAGVTPTTASIITIQRQDIFNNPNTSEGTRSVRIARPIGNVNGRFITPTNPATVLPATAGMITRTITAGNHSTSFRYYDELRGPVTFTVSSVSPTTLPTITQRHFVQGSTGVTIKLTGPVTQTAGSPVQYSIVARDIFGNQADLYVGSKSLRFGGAGLSPSGTAPTVSPAVGLPVNFGGTTSINFTAGVATAGGAVTLYDMDTDTITATDTVANIHATGGNAHTVQVVAAALHSVGAETSSGGAEVAVIVPSQLVTSGTSIVLWSVGRDLYGNTRGNVSATWALTRTGGVTITDLVPTTGVSTTFTGHATGTGIVEPRHTNPAIDSIPSGTLTVVANAAMIVRPETAPDGSGQLLSMQVTAGNSIPVYAVSRDAQGNFKGLVAADWQIINSSSPGITTTVSLTPTTNSTFTVFTAIVAGTAQIRVIEAPLTSVDSGVVTTVGGPAVSLNVTLNPSGDGSTVYMGTTRTFIIQAKDIYNNTATSYTGPKTLFFSGAQPSRAPVTYPYVTDKNGAPQNFGVGTEVNFTNGILDGAPQGSFQLFHSPHPVDDIVLSVSDTMITGTVAVVAATQPGGVDIHRIALSAPVNTIVAGDAVSLTITNEDVYGNRLPTADADNTLIFEGNPDPNAPLNPATVTPNSGAPINFGTGTTIHFDDGQATTLGVQNGVMRLYKAGIYSITAKRSDNQYPSGLEGTLVITVTPSLQQEIKLELATPQANRQSFSAPSLVTLVDVYGNPVPPRPVIITTSMPGAVILANDGGDNVINNAFDSNGSVQLSADGLDMRYEGVITSPSIFTVTTANPLGGELIDSATVTMNGGEPAKSAIRGITAPAQPYASSVTVMAGQPISLSLLVLDQDSNVVNTFDTANVPLNFGISPTPDIQGIITDSLNSPQTIGNPTSINFTGGVSAVSVPGVNGVLTLFSEGTYVLTVASPVEHATPPELALTITVLPEAPLVVDLLLSDGEANDELSLDTLSISENVDEGPVDIAPVPLASFSLVMDDSVVTAGETLSGTITMLDASSNVISNYTGPQTISFSGSAFVASPNGVEQPKIVQGLEEALLAGPTEIDFVAGVAAIGVKLYYADAATQEFAISAPVASAPVAVTVSEAAHAAFDVDLTSGQTLGTPFVGTNTVTAIDSFGNTVKSFEASDTTNVNVLVFGPPLCGESTTVSGLSGGTFLNNPNDFTDGVASVSSLTLSNPSPPCGGDYVLRFTAGIIEGESGTIVVNDEIP